MARIEECTCRHCTGENLAKPGTCTCSDLLCFECDLCVAVHCQCGKVEVQPFFRPVEKEHWLKRLGRLFRL